MLPRNCTPKKRNKKDTVFIYNRCKYYKQCKDYSKVQGWANFTCNECWEFDFPYAYKKGYIKKYQETTVIDRIKEWLNII
jgi:hypothetical protein